LVLGGGGGGKKKNLIVFEKAGKKKRKIKEKREILRKISFRQNRFWFLV